MEEPIFITGLEIENHKRISALTLQLKPKGGLIEVCGKNDQGKSTAVNSVWVAVGGADAAPPVPIQVGKSRSKITVSLSNGLKAACVFDAKGRKIAVEINGEKPTDPPQTTLNKFFGSLGFDPMAFMAMKPAAQAETLRKLVGLDFSDLEKRRLSLFAERTEVNKSVRVAENRFSVAPHHGDVGTEIISVSALAAELKAANETIRRNDAARNKVVELARIAEAKRSRVVKLQSQISELQAALEVAQSEWDSAVSEHDVREKTVESLADPDTDSLSEQIDTAEEINQKVRENQARQSLLVERDATRNRAEKLTGELESIDSQKAARLAAARFPVDGLSIDGDVVTLNGLPLSEAGTASQTMTSLEIAAALNPKVRAIMIPEGGVFDDGGSLEMVAKWAVAKDYQVFMAIPRKAIETQGILIVDGRMVEERFDDAEPELELANA